MRRPRTLPAFSPSEIQEAHQLLATRVAYMMGRKWEEGDWAQVYCGAKGIPMQGWSNLHIDVMAGNLGVEHKMLCCKSHVDLADTCGRTLFHPAATRSIRVPALDTPPDEAMRIVLTQYAELIAYRRVKVREQSGTSAEPDMRTGWLLWQDSLRQFLYFEEEMLAPEPDNYTAKWVKNVGGGSRRESTNLWVYEKETGRKRYSITTGAGPKIQPYFDVPPPTDPNLYLFTVMGEVIEAGLVRVWLTTSTARELTQLLGALDTQTVSNAILTEADSLAAGTSLDRATVETAEAILVSVEAYVALQSSVAAVRECYELLV